MSRDEVDEGMANGRAVQGTDPAVAAYKMMLNLACRSMYVCAAMSVCMRVRWMSCMGGWVEFVLLSCCLVKMVGNSSVYASVKVR